MHLVSFLFAERHPFVVSSVAKEFDAGDDAPDPRRDGRGIFVLVVRAVLLAGPVGALVGARVPGDGALRLAMMMFMCGGRQKSSGSLGGVHPRWSFTDARRADEGGGGAVEESPAESVPE